MASSMTPPGALADVVAARRDSSSIPERIVVLLYGDGRKPQHEVLRWSCLLITGSARPAEAPASRPGVCTRVWKTGDTVFHCKTCGMDPSCAICPECFANSDHTGHDYWMFASGGGCCDCGDVEAWKREGFCCHHPGPADLSLTCHACDDMPLDERAADEAVLASLSMAYLSSPLLQLSDAAIRAHGDLEDGHDVRSGYLRWLKALAATSEKTRSLIGLHLTAPRRRFIPPEGAPCDDIQIILHAVGALQAGAQAGAQAGLVDAAALEGGGISRHLVGGRDGESVLDLLLRLESSLSIPLREDVHALYFEIMRDMPFKKELLCHVIRHYPAHIDTAIHDALSYGDVPMRDPFPTTFGKFTVQFKGGLIATMVEEHLLTMLLVSLHKLLRRASMSAVATAELAAADVHAEHSPSDGAVDGEDEAELHGWGTAFLGATTATVVLAERAAAMEAALTALAAARRSTAAQGVAEAEARAAATSGDDSPMDVTDVTDMEMDGPRLGALQANGGGGDSGGGHSGGGHSCIGEWCLLPEAVEAEEVVSARSALITKHIYSQLAYDVRYALNHAPLAQQLVEAAHLVPLLMRCHTLVQGMHTLRRRTLHHIEHEDHAWADAFSLSTEFGQVRDLP